MGVVQYIFVLCVVFRINAATSKSYPADMMEESEMDTEQLIRKHNYPVETHFITTEDNYIVRCHRIPKPGGKPILLQHGLLDSSASYILMGPQKSLGYYLHDQGYDVWMGNARGNRYSRNHTTLNPDEAAFWDFSWHEIAIYDIKAMIDYILKGTGSEKLHYVGHSQGTTVIFVLCSMRPEYNDKLALVHALAPVAFMKHIRTPLLPAGENYLKLPSTKSKTEFMPKSNKFKKLCLNGKAMEDTCLNVFYMIMGKDVDQLDRTKLPLVLGHIPAGAAMKQIVHYHQLVKSDRFCQFDYGKRNQEVYGQSTPPDYDVAKITCPIALYYGLNDFLTEPKDILRLAAMLPNKVEVQEMSVPQWNHMDFLYARDAPKLYVHMEELNKKNQ